MNNLSIIIITGLSGAGKSHVANIFEDLGYYTIDNIPLQIIDNIVELFHKLDQGAAQVAFVMDSRAKDNVLILKSIKMLKSKYNATAIFMDASIDTLVKRYKETRRRHPLGSDLTEAIRKEIALMSDVKNISDITFNTDGKSVHDLSKEILSIFSRSADELIITLQSFGFKNGNPGDADLMFDVRFLRNPHFDDGLRTMSGLNDEVKDYVKADVNYAPFMNKLQDMILTLIPLYTQEGKKYLNISIGCTGGRHRSVTVAEDLFVTLKNAGRKFVRVKHRDIDM